MFRDRSGKRERVGRVDFSPASSASFAYDPGYLDRAIAAGELGISELLPLDKVPYTAEEFSPFFRGLLPEGEIFSNLAELYQVPQSDYLTLLEQMGCESIGALTFVSESVDPSEYVPRYEPVSNDLISAMASNPARMATHEASSTRLSLAGAQFKVAWMLPRAFKASSASHDDWRIPRGTAPSTHLIKISRKGEEDIALNELACSLLADSCGIEVAKVHELPGSSGAISVERYDRIWVSDGNEETVVRLHQEDFCQALGLPPFFKYQPQGVAANYPAMASELIESTSSMPQADKLEFARRLVFCYAVGNSDAHLKNFSLLYNREWTGRRLAPLYDVTCIPLTGYSVTMPFDIGEHRLLGEIDERDIMLLAADLSISLNAFDQAVSETIRTLEAPAIGRTDPDVENMVDRILDNSKHRLKVLRNYLG